MLMRGFRKFSKMCLLLSYIQSTFSYRNGTRPRIDHSQALFCFIFIFFLFFSSSSSSFLRYKELLYLFQLFSVLFSFLFWCVERQFNIIFIIQLLQKQVHILEILLERQSKIVNCFAFAKNA